LQLGAHGTVQNDNLLFKNISYIRRFGHNLPLCILSTANHYCFPNSYSYIIFKKGIVIFLNRTMLNQEMLKNYASWNDIVFYHIQSSSSKRLETLGLLFPRLFLILSDA